jgi:hypothetical protein
MIQTYYKREAADLKLKSAVSEARKLCAGSSSGRDAAALAMMLEW